MARRTHRRHRGRKRRRVAPSVSIAGYTRSLKLTATAPVSDGTILVTADVPQVENKDGETVNRKIIRIAGQSFFSAGLTTGQDCMAQFCLWAHPSQEEWPSVGDYDPFNDGPGTSVFDGYLAPRAFCRRTYVLAVPATGSSQTISSEHMVRSKAERLLRPGWKLTAGLYLRGTSGVQVTHFSLLRYVVAG